MQKLRGVVQLIATTQKEVLDVLADIVIVEEEVAQTDFEMANPKVQESPNQLVVYSGCVPKAHPCRQGEQISDVLRVPPVVHQGRLGRPLQRTCVEIVKEKIVGPSKKFQREDLLPPPCCCMAERSLV